LATHWSESVAMHRYFEVIEAQAQRRNAAQPARGLIGC